MASRAVPAFAALSDPLTAPGDQRRCPFSSSLELSGRPGWSQWSQKGDRVRRAVSLLVSRSYCEKRHTLSAFKRHRRVIFHSRSSEV